MELFHEIFDSVKSLGKEDVIRLATTSFGVLLGALLAYANQNRIERKKKAIENINSCQQALFFLGQLQENLHDMQKELEGSLKQPDRHLTLPEIIHGQDNVNFEDSSLTFLLYEKESNLVYKFSMIKREYYKLLSIRDKRNNFISKFPDMYSLSPLEEEQCKQYTDHLYNQFERCFIFNKGIMREALDTFKVKFKKVNFVVGVTNVMNR